MDDLARRLGTTMQASLQLQVSAFDGTGESAIATGFGCARLDLPAASQSANF
jgi:hypothetical protein